MTNLVLPAFRLVVIPRQMPIFGVTRQRCLACQGLHGDFLLIQRACGPLYKYIVL